VPAVRHRSAIGIRRLSTHPSKAAHAPGDDVDTGVPSHQYACAPAKAPDLTSRVSVD